MATVCFCDDRISINVAFLSLSLCVHVRACVCVCIEICVGIFYFKWRRVSHFKKKKSSAAQTEQKHSVCKKTVIQQTERHCANFQIVQKSAAFKLLKVALFFATKHYIKNPPCKLHAYFLPPSPQRMPEPGALTVHMKVFLFL